MNPRKLGKILIGIGVLLILAYIVWVVFRFVAKPDDVAQNGLLPNPFSLLNPDRQLPNATEQTPAASLGEQTVPTEIPINPETRMFRVSRFPALAYTLFTKQNSLSVFNPETGKTDIVKTPVHTVRYGAAADGTIYDTIITGTNITEKNVSERSINNIRSLQMNQYNFVGSYEKSENSYVLFWGNFADAPKVEVKTVQAKVVTTKKTTTQQDQKNQNVCPQAVVTKISYGEISREVESMQTLLVSLGYDNQFTIGVYDDSVQKIVNEISLAYKLKPVQKKFLWNPAFATALNKLCIQKIGVATNSGTPVVQNPSIENVAAVSLQPTQIELKPFAGSVSYATLSQTPNMLITMGNEFGKNNISLFDTVKQSKSQILNLPFTEWKFAPSSRGVYVTTVASGAVLGHTFLLPTGTKNDMKHIISGERGLSTIVSNDGKLLAYTAVDTGQPLLRIVRSDENSSITTTVRTFAEKCTFSSDALHLYCMVPLTLADSDMYPDDWYKHSITVTDTVVSIDTKTGLVSDLLGSDEVVATTTDGIYPSITPDESLLFWQDWNTGYIWGLRIK